jgi:hypothetical protein
MSTELKIDVNSGSTVDQHEGRIIVRGYVKNLGFQQYPFSAKDVQYSLVDPDGRDVPVKNDAPMNAMDMLNVEPGHKYEFEAELTANAPNIYVGRVYRLTATLPDGSDKDASLFTFRQYYLTPTSTTTVYPM